MNYQRHLLGYELPDTCTSTIIVGHELPEPGRGNQVRLLELHGRADQAAGYCVPARPTGSQGLVYCTMSRSRSYSRSGSIESSQGQG